MREAVAAQGHSSGVEEETVAPAVGSDGVPVVQNGPGLLPERQHAFAPPFAHHVDRVQMWLCEISAYKSGQFRHPEPRGIGEMQHCPVAHAGCGCGVRRVEQGSQLVAVEVVDQRLVETFRRDGVHLPSKVETSRSPMFQVPEGFERHESQIARADCVAPHLLQRIEEVEDERHVKLHDLDLAGPSTEPVSGEANEQLEAGGVALDCMSAGASIPR